MKKKNKILTSVSILIILGIIFSIYKIFNYQPEISYTYPQNNSNDVSEDVDLIIAFKKTPTNKNREKIRINVVPVEKYELKWDQDKLRVDFSENLKNDTSYKINVIYRKNEVYSFSFKTIIFSKKQIKTEGNLQAEGDKKFSETYKNFIDKYPWYSYLPIENKKMKIVYDFAEKKFRFRIKVSSLREGEKEMLIENAIKALEKIGVQPPVKYYILQ